MRRHRAPAPVLALAVAAALAGCATGGTPEPGSSDAAPSTVTVFAAASLTHVFDVLAERFEATRPGVEVVLSSGGSGALAQQIVAGAPADVFASAAEAPMQTVADAGLAGPPVVFATNTLQLVVPAGNPAGVSGLDDLARDELRVALCDDSVPCGAATVDLLARQGVTAAPDTLEADVTSVVTKVVLGEVDAALVYRTDVIAAGDAVEGIEVSGAASVVNRYPIAVMTDAASPDAAAEFVAFVAGAEGRAALDAAGFGAP
ncbi:molybdate ABC transporter substrate-binding protein [Agromyces sp. H66]|uniref:molybdate ABC transporter substrate-binding protein n=1 Tax=Agromyces sp. H66 TaxID=2529859 RepID=UPI0010AAA43D|nr:molybdate ABC transporter substrate-binding protein [Agromyces sp. H66]